MNINGRNSSTLYLSRFLEATITIAVLTDDAIPQCIQVGCVIPCYQHEGVRLTPTCEITTPASEIARHDRQSITPLAEPAKCTIMSYDTLLRVVISKVLVARHMQQEHRVRALPGCVWGDRWRGSYDSRATAQPGLCAWWVRKPAFISCALRFWGCCL